MDELIIDTFAVNPEVLDRLEESLNAAVQALDDVASMTRPIRQRLGWSQASLADHVGISVGRLSAYEAGKAVPDLGEAVSLVQWVRTYAPLQERLPYPSLTAIASTGDYEASEATHP